MVATDSWQEMEHVYFNACPPMHEPIFSGSIPLWWFTPRKRSVDNTVVALTRINILALTTVEPTVHVSEWYR